MAKKLNKVLVVDVEATCWPNYGDTPFDKNGNLMKNEIIEIGVCLLDTRSGEITQNRGILVTPERSTISEFCTELTTITPEMVKNEGVSLKDACKILEDEYSSKNFAWASFGAYDLKQFSVQCSDYKVPFPFGPSHINVKTLAALKFNLSKEVGMGGVLNLLKIPLEGTHHRGVDDAKNIAKILHVILK